jgi:large subunit ribosomal protein L5
MADNPMRQMRINKLVINIGTGSDEAQQTNARRLLEIITGRKPANEISRHRNPAFKISKGQKIGAFVTIRGEQARPLATKLFDAVDNKVSDRAITANGVSFGIKEYIDISGIKYDPKVGMLGMNVNLSFRRSGLRVALRKRMRSNVPAQHRAVPREEIKQFLEREFKIQAV